MKDEDAMKYISYILEIKTKLDKAEVKIDKLEAENKKLKEELLDMKTKVTSFAYLSK